MMRAGEIIALDHPEGLKSTYFPNGIYQLTAKEAVSIEDFKQRILATGEVGELSTHGIHYHLSPVKCSVLAEINFYVLPQFEAKKLTHL